MNEEQSINEDNGVESSSRRKFLKAVTTGFGALTVGSIVGYEGGAFNRLLATDAQANEEISNVEIFNKLKSFIENSSLTTLEKATSLEIANNFSHISEVNDVLMSKYYGVVDSTGKPEMLSAAEEKYSQYGVKDVESLIIFVDNDRLIKDMILRPLRQMQEGNELNSEKILNILSVMEQEVIESSMRSGEQKYRWGPQLTLLDYSKFGTKRGGTIEVGPGGEILNDEEGNKFHEHEDEIKDLLDRFPFPGDLKVNAMDSKTYEESPGYSEGFIGRIFEKAGFSEVNINLKTENIAYVLLHEVAGHGLDVAFNDIQISRYVKPETFFDLLLAREKMLNSSEWGRNYPKIEAVFSDKDLSGIYSGSSLHSIRRSIDIYPDTIFANGFYGPKRPIGGEEDKWLQRKKDEEFINEHIGLFQDSGRISYSLTEFFEDSQNSELLGNLSKDSPWLSVVMDKVRENAELLGKTKWIRDAGYDVPGVPSTNDHWFKYAMTVGQRLVVAEMFAKNDPALSMLSEEEKNIFRENLIRSTILADEELFANMMAASLMNKRVESQTPNPYAEYLQIMSDALEKDETAIIPADTLVAQLKNGLGNDQSTRVA